MKTIVKNDKWNSKVTVWFDDDMSTYEIIDNENDDTVMIIYDWDFLDSDYQVDYDKLYEAIALAIDNYIKATECTE